MDTLVYAKRLVRRSVEFLDQNIRGYSAEVVAANTWEESYKAKAWTRLEGPVETARYGAIVGFCEVYASDRVLDIGCGHGLLQTRLQRLEPKRYLGTDISAQAIAMALERSAGTGAEFLVSDAETCAPPTETFGLIVFNECLYYMRDPRAVVEKFATSLAPGGHIIVSMYDRPRTRAAWKLMPASLELLDAARVINQKARLSWTIRVFAARSRS